MGALKGWLLLCVSVFASTIHQEVDNTCVTALANVVFTRVESPAYTRDHSELLKRYKNDPEFAYWLTHQYEPVTLFNNDPYDPAYVLQEFALAKSAQAYHTQELRPKRVFFTNDA